MTLILSTVTSFILTFFVLLLLLKTNLKHLALDTPNQRSLHQNVIPRSGGLAIMAGILLTCAFHAVIWLIPILVLMAVSLMDDIKGLSIKWRFLIQTFVAAVFVYYLDGESSWWIEVCIIFSIVWMINLYNFMDGSDGLAGGMALIGFSVYAFAAFMMDNTLTMIVSASVAGSSLAFLLFNFNPAKIFMGDSGSIPLGFLAASIGLYGWQQNNWPFWFPLVVFSPFIVDATITLLKRLLQGEKIWNAHRTHYYQRLVQLGWGHKKTAIAEYLLMATMAITALIALIYPAFLNVYVVGWIVLYCLLIILIDKAWRNFSA